MTEEQLQAECYRWFWNKFIEERQMLFHVDNNSYNGIIGNRKKSLGVVKGISDFIFILPNGRTAFIEMKTEKGYQKPEQREFMHKVCERGHEYYICRSVDQFKTLILKLLLNESLGNC